MRRRRLGALARGSDLALAYATAVVGAAVVMAALPAARRARVVLDCSTNVTNLRHEPVRVLALSAFVVTSPWELLLLVPLVVAVTAATRWIGRVATGVALVFGHAFTTLTVAALIAAGLHRGVLDPGIARAPDVGTSYALAGVAGLLLARWHGWKRFAYVAAAVVLLVVLLLADPDFTEVGHALAFVIGAGLAAVAAGSSAHLSAAPPA